MPLRADITVMALPLMSSAAIAADRETFTSVSPVARLGLACWLFSRTQCLRCRSHRLRKLCGHRFLRCRQRQVFVSGTQAGRTKFNRAHPLLTVKGPWSLGIPSVRRSDIGGRLGVWASAIRRRARSGQIWHSDLSNFLL